MAQTVFAVVRRHNVTTQTDVDLRNISPGCVCCICVNNQETCLGDADIVVITVQSVQSETGHC